MTASEFYDWKRHPVTQQIFSALQARVDFLKEEIVEQAATVSQTELAEKAGAVKAINDLLTITYEESHGN